MKVDQDTLESSKHDCPDCKKTYKNKKQLRKHIRMLHQLHKCPNCPLKFSKRELAFHRQSNHGNKLPTCGVCGYVNLNQRSLVLHQRKVHLKEKNAQCDICSLQFYGPNEVKRHMVSHQPQQLHECSYCKKKFPRRPTMLLHQKIHTGEKNKVCSVCGASFVQKASLNYHMKKYHPESRTKSKYQQFFEVICEREELIYVCRVCGHESQTQMQILRHVPKRHSREISCPQCHLLFLDPAQREAHISQPHPAVLPKHICETCKREFKSKAKFQRHVRMIHNKHKCALCPEMLFKKDMPKHNKRFHGESMPTCGVCGVKALTQGLIVKHQRMVHLKEKNVTCDICKSQFFGLVCLRKHMIRHRVEKFSECSFCKKKFPRKTAMRTHEMIHLGVRNKICAVCGASFVQKASLNYHMIKHHPEAK